MKLQDASVKEIRRVCVGAGICLILMLAILYVLSRAGIGSFDYRVILSGAIGSLIAVGNFMLLCLTIQKAAASDDPKQMKARFQLSYNARLIAQAAWVVVAFLAPCFQPVPAAIPLLFPTLVIYYLQLKGKQVTPSQRNNPPQEQEEGQDTDES